MINENIYNNDIEYYNILNISPESDINNIKKAYRHLSIKYHPDKNNNCSNLFNKITNAYQYLIKKKETNIINSNVNSNVNSNINSTLDNNMINDNNTNNTNNKINPNQIIESNIIYSNVSSNFDTIINSCKDDINSFIEITFEQSYLGGSIPIEINRILFNNNILKNEKETIYIELPRGIDNNEIITINNRGNCYNNLFTDIKITIQLLEHLIFKRDGLNLIYTANISFKESIVGFNIILKHLNSKSYKLLNTDNELIHNNSFKTIKELGFVRNNFKGDLIIKFDINYPKKLDNNIIKQLKDIL